MKLFQAYKTILNVQLFKIKCGNNDMCHDSIVLFSVAERMVKKGEALLTWI